MNKLLKIEFEKLGKLLSKIDIETILLIYAFVFLGYIIVISLIE
jgi:hypothetical protein